MLKLLVLWCVILGGGYLFFWVGSGEPKISLLISPWVLDVLHDFGMGFPSQDFGTDGY